MYKPKEPAAGKEDVQDAKTADTVTSAGSTVASGVAPNTSKPLATTVTGPNVGTYGPQNVSHVPELSRAAWEATNNRGLAWSDDPKSRLAVRMFSRGVMGAAFFTAGGLLTRKQMSGANQYNPTASFTEQQNALQFIAKSIDTLVGTPIKKVVTAVAGEQAGLSAVHFRPTNFRTYGNQMRGRSLGDETVNITFDFFSASVGDAWGRDLAAIIDPNAKKSWIDDKGHVSVSKAFDSAAKAATHYVTYNGGEDWAVAIPYAYFMKGQRHLLAKANPGFQYDFDQGLNGGSFKLHDNKIVGNYNKTGMLDIQTRFTMYNIGTLMYREVYAYVGNLLNGKPAQLYGSPDQSEDAHMNLADRAGNLLKWGARSAVKGAIIMTPSVPFFSITRTPQTKHRGIFIDPEKGSLGYAASPGVVADSLHANSRGLEASRYVDYWSYQHMPDEPNLSRHRVTSPGLTVGNFDPTLVARSTGENRFNAYGRTYGPVDALINVPGKLSTGAANVMTGPAAVLDNIAPSVTHTVKEALGVTEHTSGRFIRPMTYAAISYTPYMYAKAEFSNLWDNGKMDMAAERMINGATRFSWGEFKKGLNEVYNTVRLRPLDDPQREAEGQRRMLVDTSAADTFQETQAQQALKKEEKSHWRERMVSGQPIEKKIIAEHDAKGQASQAQPQKKPSYAEQEEMLKVLKKVAPPTNSIN